MLELVVGRSIVGLLGAVIHIPWVAPRLGTMSSWREFHPWCWAIATTVVVLT